MELASRPARGSDTAVFMAAKAHGHVPVVCNQLATDHRISDLRADGLGHLRVAGAALGADAIAKLGMGFATLGTQFGLDDYLCPRAASVALRMEEAG